MRPPRIPNWLPGHADTIYFLTLCVEGRHAVLDNSAAWDLCRAVWRRLDRWQVLAAIAMPDHLHLLLSPLADRHASLSAWMKWFKRWFNEGYADICRASVPDASNCSASVSDAGLPSVSDASICSASVSDAGSSSVSDAGAPPHRDGPQRNIVGRLCEAPPLCETPVPLRETPAQDAMPWRWMEGGFDRLLRGEESPQEKWQYMRLNPVRAGLVKRPEDWPYQMGLGSAL